MSQHPSSGETDSPSARTKRSRQERDEEDNQSDNDDKSKNNDNDNENLPYYDKKSNFWYWNSKHFGKLFMDEPDYHPPKWEECHTRDMMPMGFHVNKSYTQQDNYDYTKTIPPIPSAAVMERAMQIGRDKVRQEEVMKQIIQTLWDDWHGRFQRRQTDITTDTNGGWWTNNVALVKEEFDRHGKGQQMPTSAQELDALLERNELLFFEPGSFGWETNDKTPGVWVDLAFDGFEEEHGIGVVFGMDCETIQDIKFSYLASY